MQTTKSKNSKGTSGTVVRLETEHKRDNRARFKRLPDAVHQVHERLKQQVVARIKIMLDVADDVLFDMADKAVTNQEQNLFFDAMREVRVQRRELQERFEVGVDDAFLELVDVDAAHRKELKDSLKAEKLSLVQKEELEETIALDSSIARATSEFGEQVQLISLRLDSIVPVKVYEQNNPFSPRCLCETFMEQVRRLDIDIKSKLVLYKLFDKEVVFYLADIYKQINEMFVANNVLPSLHNVKKPVQRKENARIDSKKEAEAFAKNTIVPTPEAHTAPLTPPGSSPMQHELQVDAKNKTPQAASSKLGSGPQLKSDILETLNSILGIQEASGRQEESVNSIDNNIMGSGEQGFAIQLDDTNSKGLSNAVPNALKADSNGANNHGAIHGGSRPGVASFGSSENDLINLLTYAQRSSTAESGIDLSDINLDIRSALDKILYKEGRQITISRVDDEVINLVHMMFEFIVEDRNLPVEMKALICRMQIPIIKVAIVDKHFFTTSNHPAKRLLNEMSSAALGWSGDAKAITNDPLHRKFETIVNRLLEDFNVDVEIFGDLLRDLIAYLEKEKRKAAVIERRTLDAEDGKAKTELARQIVDVEIELRTINESLPSVVSNLIQQAWSNVLFVSGLKYGYDSNHWTELLKTLDYLIWSTRAPANETHRRELLRIIPILSKRIHAGLDTISYNPFEMSKLFKELEEVHLGAIRTFEVKNTGTIKTETLQEAMDDDKRKSNTIIPSLTTKQEMPKDTSEEDDADANENLRRNLSKAQAYMAKTQEHAKQKITDELSSSVDVNALEEGGDKTGVKTKNASLQSKSTGAEKSQNTRPTLPEDDPQMKQVSRFAQGTWFEFTDNEKSLRCRLAAFVKPTGKYIFVNRNGMKVAEKTQSDLAYGLKDDTVHSLDNTMLFDRALETVVSSLRKSN